MYIRNYLVKDKKKMLFHSNKIDFRIAVRTILNYALKPFQTFQKYIEFPSSCIIIIKRERVFYIQKKSLTLLSEAYIGTAF